MKTMNGIFELGYTAMVIDGIVLQISKLNVYALKIREQAFFNPFINLLKPIIHY